MSANYYWEPVERNKREFECDYISSQAIAIGAPRIFRQSDMEYLRGHADAGNKLAGELHELLCRYMEIEVTCES